MVSTPIPVFTRDRGKNWIQVKGLFYDARPIADRVDPSAFYAMNFTNGRLFISTDGGATFKSFKCKRTSGGHHGATSRPGMKGHGRWWPLPANRTTCGLSAAARSITRLMAGRISRRLMERSTFNSSVLARPPRARIIHPFSSSPARGAAPGGIKAIWRSDDIAVSWVRVNDDQHQYGTRFRCIAGDPRDLRTRLCRHRRPWYLLWPARRDRRMIH